MASRSKSILALLRQKSKHNFLNWHEFNFLENLLIFCAQPSLWAPKESGIGFRITPGKDNSSVCVLFKIDREGDPLVTDPKTPRPDYLVLYHDGHQCILTVIEMKAGKDTGRAFKQIVAFKNLLRTEIGRHLPGRFASKLRLQGIMLTSFGQQVPLKAIEREEKAGFVILPLQYSHSAELFPYISSANRLTDGGKRIRYRHLGIGRGRDLSAIETIVVNGALHARVSDEILSRHSPGPKRTGIYINYANQRGAYCALVADPDQATIVCTNEEREFLEFIVRELAKTGAGSVFKIDILE